MRTPESIAAEIAPGLEIVPRHLRSGLKRYLVDREKPGSFLQALIRNDLADAILRADDESLPAMRDLVLFLHNYAPATAHGSPEAMDTWLLGGGGPLQ